MSHYKVVVVRLFIDTQNRLVTLHSVPFKRDRVEGLFSLRLMKRRTTVLTVYFIDPIGSKKKCLKKSALPLGDQTRFYPCLRS
jgi:hypothetical protein